MGIPAAIVTGALIIAATVAATSHWSFAVGPMRDRDPDFIRPGVFRLNRWTGTVVWCGPRGLPDPTSAVVLQCEAK